MALNRSSAKRHGASGYVCFWDGPVPASGTQLRASGNGLRHWLDTRPHTAATQAKELHINPPPPFAHLSLPVILRRKGHWDGTGYLVAASPALGARSQVPLDCARSAMQCTSLLLTYTARSWMLGLLGTERGRAPCCPPACLPVCRVISCLSFHGVP